MLVQGLYAIAGLLVIAASFGAAYGGVKKGMNGQKSDISEIKDSVKDMNKTFTIKLDSIKDQTLENKNQIQNQRAVCLEREKQINKLESKIGN